MPVLSCQKDNRPGFKWGEGGACFTFTRGNPQSRKRAQDKAIAVGRAIAFSRAREAGRSEPTSADFD